jgi:hypothetical protein
MVSRLSMENRDRVLASSVVCASTGKASENVQPTGGRWASCSGPPAGVGNVAVRRQHDDCLRRLFKYGAREALGGCDLFGAAMDRKIGQPDQRRLGVADRDRPRPDRDRQGVIAIAQ